MSTKMVDSNQAHSNWRDVLDMVLGQDVDVIITRYGKPVATMLDYEDYLGIREELSKKRALRRANRHFRKEVWLTMLASEKVLAREWDTPEEDEAWQHL